LFKALGQATFETLVLDGTLKQEILDDVRRFFAARELYESYGVPWKRGILFLGPPGNGKTHAVKAVINAVAQPCLYVKSVANTAAILEVFEQARRSAPCVLVLEDLDTLVVQSQRSVLLNELDGFAVNAGILTLATANHPEKLDPALIDRPSRFDRKYHFELPAHDARSAYIRSWNASLQPALQISEKTIADLVAETEGFSFAYLKELFVSATMRWMAVQAPGAMDGIVQDELILLLCQMPSPDPGSGGKRDKSKNR
ncbi:MAG: AAA family ATPase, partial [Chloroflexota bacterium]